MNQVPYLDANPAAVSIIGYPKNKILKLTSSDIICEGREPMMKVFCKRILMKVK